MLAEAHLETNESLALRSEIGKYGLYISASLARPIAMFGRIFGGVFCFIEKGVVATWFVFDVQQGGITVG